MDVYTDASYAKEIGCIIGYSIYDEHNHHRITTEFLPQVKNTQGSCLI